MKLDIQFIVAVLITISIVVMIVTTTYILFPSSFSGDIIPIQSEHCSSITSISDKIRCLEARIDLLQERITELEK